LAAAANAYLDVGQFTDMRRLFIPDEYGLVQGLAAGHLQHLQHVHTIAGVPLLATDGKLGPKGREVDRFQLPDWDLGTLLAGMLKVRPGLRISLIAPARSERGLDAWVRKGLAAARAVAHDPYAVTLVHAWPKGGWGRGEDSGDWEEEDATDEENAGIADDE
jgi:hypothetical protein